MLNASAVFDRTTWKMVVFFAAFIAVFAIFVDAIDSITAASSLSTAADLVVIIVAGVWFSTSLARLAVSLVFGGPTLK